MATRSIPVEGGRVRPDRSSLPSHHPFPRRAKKKEPEAGSKRDWNR
jgi:hypothetical protein